MSDRNDYIFKQALGQKLTAADEAQQTLNDEKRAAEKLAILAEAYRQMPADMLERAKTWGVAALMEAVWLNGWDCGYRQCVRDAGALVSPGGVGR